MDLRSRGVAPGWRLAAWAMGLLLAGCGGGGGDAGTPADPAAPASCSVADREAWLSAYFKQNYFWTALSPRPAPGSSATVEAYFRALLYGGTNAAFPADIWSNYQSTESFNRVFSDGQTMGYGLAVAGLEVSGQTGRPLYVRTVDAGSPAAAAGLTRGDVLLTLGGRPAGDLVASGDFGLLTPAAVGDALALRWRDAAGVERAATLRAAVYTLTPVPQYRVLTTAGGRRVGYVEVRTMIGQAEAALETAFAAFAAGGVQDLVLDLRYNGGGLVSVGATLASYIGGRSVAGLTYAELRFNDQLSASNTRYSFRQPALSSAASLPRAFVLAGRRTCSASEQVINGLRGAGIPVTVIGDTTCGKPVGFVPRADGCGTTYSVVNFESVNARGEGRYFAGIAATCAVAEDWTRPVGQTGDPLLAAASRMADGGLCPTAGQRMQPTGWRTAGRAEDGGQPGGMLAQ